MGARLARHGPRLNLRRRNNPTNLTGVSTPPPRRLAADNFTPPSRTPWGGTKIRRRYKAELDLRPGDPVVGESWEVSVEPSFPSRCADGELTLAELVTSDPLAWLGARDAEAHGQTPLLIKLLDAADDLSVQVHPADGDAALAEDESGKPEAWIVLEAEPGAGLYLGFVEGVDRDAVARCIARGGALNELMQFVPVSPGDAFVIAAGTPHAIGAGVTLVEPQLVRPGKRGVTYRFWDWNRRYDEMGRRDAAGAPRELHLERSLEVTSWSAPRGDTFVATCRSTPTVLEGGIRGSAMRRERVVDWRWFVVERWRGTGRLAVEASERMMAITCARGRLTVETMAGELALRGGESGVVPAAGGALLVTGTDTLAFATRTA